MWSLPLWSLQSTAVLECLITVQSFFSGAAHHSEIRLQGSPPFYCYNTERGHKLSSIRSSSCVEWGEMYSTVRVQYYDCL